MKKILKIFLIAIFVLITGTSAFAAFSFKNMCLRVVQISDTHISDRENTSYKLLSSSKELLKEAISKINQIQGVDFVMFTGDMVDQPTLSSYKDFFEILKDLNYPSLVTFGNHDRAMCANGQCTDGLTKKEAIDVIRKCNPNYVFNGSYYAFSPKKDYRIIVLDGTIDDEVTSNGYYSEEQLKFLDSQLEPFVSEHHKVRNAEAYLDILAKYNNPILVMSGHYHATKITKINNLIFVSTPSLVTYPNAFRMVDITNYEDRTIFNFQFFETDMKDIQEQAKQSTIAATTFYGVKDDRVRTIVEKKKYVKKDKKKKQREEEDLYEGLDLEEDE